MDTNERIHIELLKRLKVFSENYIPSKPNENSNNPKKHSQEKPDKSHKRRFSRDIKKKKNMNYTNSPKKKNRNFESTVSTNNFHGKNQFYKNTYYSQDKPIKINLVSQKFRIADDFNEKNSNQFLKEKDECLKKIILSDVIEETEKEEAIFFYSKNEKENIFKLSTIKKNIFNSNLNNKYSKRKIIEYDSRASLSELIEELK